MVDKHQRVKKLVQRHLQRTNLPTVGPAVNPTSTGPVEVNLGDLNFAVLHILQELSKQERAQAPAAVDPRVETLIESVHRLSLRLEQHEFELEARSTAGLAQWYPRVAFAAASMALVILTCSAVYIVMMLLL